MAYLATQLWTIILFGLANCRELDEKRLHHYLMENKKYHKSVMPPKRENAVRLTVNLGLRLSQLLDMDEKNQIMTTSVWLHQEWYDPRLEWDPKEYGDLKLTYIPSNDLWKPDIVLYNNADGDFHVKLLTKAKVEHNGRITWEPPVIYKSYCPIDIEFFPFDIQECFLKFGLWTYDGSLIDLQHVCSDKAVYINETDEEVIDRGIDIKDVYPNAEWDIINVTARRREKFYTCCKNVFYIDITFNITLRRRILFYSLNLIMPCVSISGLAVLVFYLPSDSGEKITLSISVLLALSVFFLLLSDIMPPTSLVIPMIGKYLLFTMSVVTLSIFLTVYTLGINFRRPSTGSMPVWIKVVFTELLPRILLMERPALDSLDINEPNNMNSCNNCNGIDQGDLHPLPNVVVSSDIIRDSTRGPQVTCKKQYSRTVLVAFQEVKYIAKKLEEDEKKITIIRDWKFIAMVMDRLFLFIFTTACICGTVSLLIQAPSLYDVRPALSNNAPLDSCSF